MKNGFIPKHTKAEADRKIKETPTLGEWRLVILL